MIALLWPITHPFAELPTYFQYCVKGIEKKTQNGTAALFICSMALAFQHITLPLIFDWKYIAWRFSMFLLLAIYIGIVLKIRPKLFPYLAIGHGLIDLPIVLMFFAL